MQEIEMKNETAWRHVQHTSLMHYASAFTTYATEKLDLGLFFARHSLPRGSPRHRDARSAAVTRQSCRQDSVSWRESDRNSVRRDDDELVGTKQLVLHWFHVEVEDQLRDCHVQLVLRESTADAHARTSSERHGGKGIDLLTRGTQPAFWSEGSGVREVLLHLTCDQEVAEYLGLMCPREGGAARESGQQLGSRAGCSDTYPLWNVISGEDGVSFQDSNNRGDGGREAEGLLHSRA